MSFAIRILLFLQILQIALRVDCRITWDWNLVFWILWIIAIMSIFYVMGLSILLILTLYYKYFGQAENFQSSKIFCKIFYIFFEVIGLFWCFSNISNFVLGIFLILKGVINLLTKNNSGINFQPLNNNYFKN